MTKISLIKGDITKLKVDAIVNAANNGLLGGGGVDGAIHAAAGPELLKECRQLKYCETGSAKITKAYQLKTQYIIHTVGPIFANHHKDQAVFLLESAYNNSLVLANKYGVKSIAFPNISTGVYGYPKLEAANIAIHAVKNYVETNSSFSEIVFCVFDTENYDIYYNILNIKDK